MKDYFKYENGYVNINDENLFLTNSGNWSETHGLSEKSAQSIRKNQLKRFRINAYLFVMGSVVLFLLFHSQNKLMPLGILGLGIAAYFYMKRETGNRYRIPLEKIKAVEISGNQVKIVFLNLSGKEDAETIIGVEEKGISILDNLGFHQAI